MSQSSLELKVNILCAGDVSCVCVCGQTKRIIAQLHPSKAPCRTPLLSNTPTIVPGSKLKEIGTLARHDLEAFFDKKVFLQMSVKVKKDWRSKESDLLRFGYLPTNE